MKKLFGVLITLVLAAVCTETSGEIKHYQIQSKTGEGQNALSVYLPEDYNTLDASYPVLYLLHGYGGNDLTFLGKGYGDQAWMADANVSVIVDRFVQEGRIKPLIVACPDITNIGLIDDLRDFISFVDATFRTIANRSSRAIAGHSFGGYRSLRIALANPELFGTVGGFSTSGTSLSVFAELAKAYDQRSFPIRIWLYAGTNDQEGATQPNRDLATALKQSGLPTEYIEDDGDHINKVAKRLGEYIEYCAEYLKW